MANLDRPCSRRMLDGLSQADADALRQAVDELGSVDPEERSDVMHEFRRIASVSVDAPDAVEVTWSNPAKDISLSLDDITRQGKDSLPENEERPYSFLCDADTQSMAKLLVDEHPQTVAVVMSELSADLAAELLSSLPGPLQADVLERLAEQHPAEPQAVRIVESHLAHWFENHREREQRLSQGQEKIEQILAKTSGHQREKIIAQLGRRNESLAGRFASSRPPALPPFHSPASSPFQPPALPGGMDTAKQLAQENSINPSTPSDPPAEPGAEMGAWQLTDLAAISDHVLLETLKQAEPHIAMLALAGADAELVDRIASQLSWRQARRFRRQLRKIEPTKLSDMLAAQHEFAQLAYQVVAGETTS